MVIDDNTLGGGWVPNPNYNSKTKKLDAQIDGIVKTDKPFQFETDDITGTSLAVGKPFDELSKKDQV